MDFTYTINGKLIDFNVPKIMAIINVSPNSFYANSIIKNNQQLLTYIEKKITEGADIIDIGAVSTKPFVDAISEHDELLRIEKHIHVIRKTFPKIFLSIDTTRAKVAQLAINYGVDVINDISGGNMDHQMFDVVSKSNVLYVLTHMQGTPQTMQLNPYYQNVVTDVYHALKCNIDQLQQLHFKNIIVDVGFGFGKTIEHNFKLLKNLSYYTSLQYPILVGLSRKSMIYKLLNIIPEQALNGTSILNLIALQNSAKILRVHDVVEAKQTIDIYTYYNLTL